MNIAAVGAGRNSAGQGLTAAATERQEAEAMRHRHTFHHRHRLEPVVEVMHLDAGLDVDERLAFSRGQERLEDRILRRGIEGAGAAAPIVFERMRLSPSVRTMMPGSLPAPPAKPGVEKLSLKDQALPIGCTAKFRASASTTIATSSSIVDG